MKEFHRFVLTTGDFIEGDSIWVVGRNKDNFPIIMSGQVSNIAHYEHKTFGETPWKPIKQVRVLLPVEDMMVDIDQLFKKAHFKKAKERVKYLMREHKEMLAQSVVDLQNKCSRFKEHKAIEKAKVAYITSSLKDFLNEEGILEEVNKFKENYKKEKDEETTVWNVE